MTKKQENQPVVGISADSNQLHLTEQQELAIELWEMGDFKQIAAAVGVTPEVLRDWEDQNIFRVARLNKGDNYGANMDELQAVALTLDSVSFADAEEVLELDAGTIADWATDSDSVFACLLREMKAISMEPTHAEWCAKHEAENKALKDQQMLAIPHILAGKSDAQVAEAVGVARETVNRWRNHDEDFIQDELSQSRVAQVNARVIALSSVNAKAIEVMEELLDSDDEQIRMRAAMHLLKTVPLTHKNQ